MGVNLSIASVSNARSVPGKGLQSDSRSLKKIEVSFQLVSRVTGNGLVSPAILGLLRSNLLLFALLLGGAQASWAQEAQEDLDCVPRFTANQTVNLGSKNLTCTGPGSKTVKSIQGMNGVVNIVTLQDEAGLTLSLIHI